jgi:ADP-ribosylglycohydrolase
MENKVKAGIVGVCIGDALGVPVEFKRRPENKSGHQNAGIYVLESAQRNLE